MLGTLVCLRPLYMCIVHCSQRGCIWTQVASSACNSGTKRLSCTTSLLLILVCTPWHLQRQAKLTKQQFYSIFVLQDNAGGGACGFLAILQAVGVGTVAYVRHGTPITADILNDT